MLSGKVRVALRILIVILLLFGFAVGGVYVGYNYVISQDKRFNALKSDIDAGKYKITQETEGAVCVVIRSADPVSTSSSMVLRPGTRTSRLQLSR